LCEAMWLAVDLGIAASKAVSIWGDLAAGTNAMRKITQCINGAIHAPPPWPGCTCSSTNHDGAKHHCR
jgi:hypothetical protein